VEGFCRPYARAVAGTPLKMRFDRVSGRFELTFRADPAVKAPTEIYAPKVQYPRGLRAQADSGRVEVLAEAQRVLVHDVNMAREVRVTLERV
jgi:hypothetical protein